MRNEKVFEWLSEKGFADRVIDHTETIDTVEHAAIQLGCSEAEIAKTLSFLVNDQPVIVVMAGDGRVNCSKFKAQFHTKAKMIPFASVEEYLGHPPGGVCPFALKDGVKVYLDVSLRVHETVFPAAGSENSAIETTIDQLERFTSYKEWVDVCKK